MGLARVDALEVREERGEGDLECANSGVRGDVQTDSWTPFLPALADLVSLLS